MVNTQIIVGHLGSEPEGRTTPGGKAVADFRVAASYGSGDAKVTEWFSVVAWEKLADIATKYLHKGSKVYVSGRTQTKQYTDKDGVTKYRTEVIANEIKMLDAKAEGTETPAPAQPSTSRRVTKPADDDSLPF